MTGVTARMLPNSSVSRFTGGADAGRREMRTTASAKDTEKNTPVAVSPRTAERCRTRSMATATAAVKGRATNSDASGDTPITRPRAMPPNAA